MEKLELLKEILGVELLLEEVLKYLSNDEEEEIMDYIGNIYDIEMEEA